MAAGLGIAVLPEREFTDTLRESVRMLPIRAPQLVRNIGIIGNAARSLSPAAERFVEVLRQTVKPADAASVVSLKRVVASRQP